MTDDPPASLPPSKIPGTSNRGPYIALGALLLLVGVGVVIWKSRGPEPTPPAITPTLSSGSVARPTLTDAPPPPPPDEPPPPTPTAKVRSTGGGCGGPCGGNASSGLLSEVQARAGRARGCYQRALRQNEGLRGSMSVALRIDTGGTICSAGVAGDTTGSPEVARCVVSMFQGQRLGSAPSGGCVDMKVPLRFEAVNK
ncbi:MAG TPA: AgmX/PglI C-terminal domain-containing protein [Polyangiaceae bacterium]|nr:AgmX/PglI C-terminal domain-containing protein [Polyangiaceae bacterium]